MRKKYCLPHLQELIQGPNRKSAHVFRGYSRPNEYFDLVLLLVKCHTRFFHCLCRRRRCRRCFCIEFIHLTKRFMQHSNSNNSIIPILAMRTYHTIIIIMNECECVFPSLLFACADAYTFHARVSYYSRGMKEIEMIFCATDIEFHLRLII